MKNLKAIADELESIAASIRKEYTAEIKDKNAKVGDDVKYKGYEGKVVETEKDGAFVYFSEIKVHSTDGREKGFRMHFYYEDLKSKEGHYQAVD